MLTKKELKILKKLQNCDYVKSQELEEILGVSNKTARKMILQLSDKIKVYGAAIESKPGKGYLLEVYDQELLNHIFIEKEMVFEDSESRWEYLVKLFVESDEFHKIDNLAEILYVSQKVVSNSVKKAEEFLNNYNLQLERKSYHGIRLLGDEYDKRRCMIALAKRNHFLHVDEKLVTIINYIFIKYNITMSQTAKESFMMHLQYSINRLIEGKYVEIDTDSMRFVKEDFFKESLYISKELANMLKDEYDVQFPSNEIYSIALHITDKKFYEKNTGNIVIDEEVSSLVSEVLESIKNTYGLDFENDLDIYTMLVKHMIPLRMRIETGSDLKNPLLDDIQNQYPFAMTIAKGINPIIKQYFSKRISEDELSYIAIAIQLAIEKRKTRNRRKKNILIVCASGNISSKLFEYRFQEMFKDSIGSSKICSYTDLINYDFTNIDYVFATVPVDIKLPIPIYQMTEQILSQRVSLEIQKMLDLSNAPLLSKFSPTLFFTHVYVKNKEELLRMMCDKSRMEKKLPEEFYDLVMKRESMLETAYGNWVALPHPYKTVSKETFVCTALLDEEIMWGTQKVKAVFLVAVSDNKNEDLDEFYDDFFDFVLNKENIKSLLEDQTFENLLTLLEKLKEKH